MSKGVIEEVRLLAPLVETTSEIGRARQRRKLTDAIAAESTPVRQEELLESVGAVVSLRTRHTRRGRSYLAGGAAAVVAAAGVAIPLSFGTTTPAATRITNGAATRITKGATTRIKGAAPVMALASYRLRLPKSYRLTAATTTVCPALDVAFVSPDPTPGTWTADGTASAVQTPGYASDMAAAANAEGGCIAMVLAPPYTPTTADPDPESGTFENTQPVQVGPYEGRVGTWTMFAKPSNVATQQAGLYVEIPLAGGQDRDLVVSSNNLSESALVALVATGLSVAGSSSTSDATGPTSGTSGTTGNTSGNTGSASNIGTAGNSSSASTSNQNS
jgi:hypothetical protein